VIELHTRTTIQCRKISQLSN